MYILIAVASLIVPSPTATRRPRTSRRDGVAAAMLAVIAVASIAACADAPSAIHSEGSRTLPPRDRPESPAQAPAVVARLLEQLQRPESTSEYTSRMRATVAINGATQTLDGSRAIVEALHPLLAARIGDQQTTGSQTTSASSVPTDGESVPLRIHMPASFVIPYASKFMFTSVTLINQTTTARFRFSAKREASAFFAGGHGIKVLSDSAQKTTVETGGIGSVAWDDLVLSGGCRFGATINTVHDVDWPWTFVVPGGVMQSVRGQSVGANEMQRTCAPHTPPPALDENPCLDPDEPGCDASPPAVGVVRTGGGTARVEMARHQDRKTVCLVTDWYENGVYVETTIDGCWTEAIT